MDSTFQGAIDRWNSVTVNSQEEPCEIKDFTNKLSASLRKWSKEERRCVWFKVHIQDSELVPLLAKEDFKFHHSRDDFLMMYKWIQKNSTSNLPPACHTNLGVGGMVFNDHNQLLVVTEKFHSIPHWKLPGGYVERGEDIRDAVIREVKEETGIDSIFESMVTLRHTHDTTFHNSDIYVVMTLQAASNVITKSESEISECKWMDVNEYLEHPNVIEFNRFLVSQALDLRKRNIKLNLQKKTVHIGKLTKETTALIIEDSTKSKH